MKVHYSIEAAAFNNEIKLIFCAKDNGKSVRLPADIASTLTGMIQNTLVIPKELFLTAMDYHLEVAMCGPPSNPSKVLWCDCKCPVSTDGYVQEVFALLRRKNIQYDETVLQEYAALVAKKLKDYLENAKIAFPAVHYTGEI